MPVSTRARVAVAILSLGALVCISCSPRLRSETARAGEGDSPTVPRVTQIVVADGHGWTPAGIEGPRPASGSCHYRKALDGFDLPDPTCTPGAVDPAVNSSDLGSTICRSGGYSASVRPPEKLTEAAKFDSMDAYSDPLTARETELDHLIPLSLGGASDTRNLWAEPDQGSPSLFDPTDPFGINAKDGVEDALHNEVCSGRVSLAAAQQAIASDWTTALTRLGLSG